MLKSEHCPAILFRGLLSPPVRVSVSGAGHSPCLKTIDSAGRRCAQEHARAQPRASGAVGLMIPLSVARPRRVVDRTSFRLLCQCRGIVQLAIIRLTVTVAKFESSQWQFDSDPGRDS